jgi:amidase
MTKIRRLREGARAAMLATFALQASGKSAPGFNVVETSIRQMQAAMKAGKTTSHEIVLQYLARIGAYED